MDHVESIESCGVLSRISSSFIDLILLGLFSYLCVLISGPYSNIVYDSSWEDSFGVKYTKTEFFRYEVSQSSDTLPSHRLKSFLKKHLCISSYPNRLYRYSFNKKHINIPTNELSEFLRFYPNAKLDSISTKGSLEYLVPSTKLTEFKQLCDIDHVMYKEIALVEVYGTTVALYKSDVKQWFKSETNYSIKSTYIATSSIPYDIDIVKDIVLFSVYGLVCLFCYVMLLAVSESSRLKGTIGMFIIGLSVVDEHKHYLTYERAFIRGLLKVINLLMLGIGFLWVFNRNHRTLYDIWSKTYVICKEKKSENRALGEKYWNSL